MAERKLKNKLSNKTKENTSNWLMKRELVKRRKLNSSMMRALQWARLIRWQISKPPLIISRKSSAFSFSNIWMPIRWHQPVKSWNQDFKESSKKLKWNSRLNRKKLRKFNESLRSMRWCKVGMQMIFATIFCLLSIRTILSKDMKK